MKYVWILLLTMSTANLFAQYRMATYQEVYDEFYDNNAHSSIMDIRVSFEKKKGKWYVTTYDHSDYMTPDSSYLFYAHGKFQQLPSFGIENDTSGQFFKEPINQNDIIKSTI